MQKVLIESNDNASEERLHAGTVEHARPLNDRAHEHNNVMRTCPAPCVR